MGSFKDLTVYVKAFRLSHRIFMLSKNFPPEEKYSLTDQIRRSSRSVCANIGEAYRKRKYSRHFISKLSDADMENAETQVWLQFARQSEYIDRREFKTLTGRSDEIGSMLHYMMKNPDQFKDGGT